MYAGQREFLLLQQYRGRVGDAPQKKLDRTQLQLRGAGARWPSNVELRARTRSRRASRFLSSALCSKPRSTRHVASLTVFGSFTASFVVDRLSARFDRKLPLRADVYIAQRVRQLSTSLPDCEPTWHLRISHGTCRRPRTSPRPVISWR